MRIPSSLALAAAAVLLAACESTVPTDPPVPSTVEVLPGELALEEGGSATLAAVVRGADGGVMAGQAVAWSSADAGVASVGASGTVQGIAPGVTEVRARSGAGQTTVRVTVTPRDLELAYSAYVTTADGAAVTSGTIQGRVRLRGALQGDGSVRYHGMAPATYESFTLIGTDEGGCSIETASLKGGELGFQATRGAGAAEISATLLVPADPARRPAENLRIRCPDAQVENTTQMVTGLLGFLYGPGSPGAGPVRLRLPQAGAPTSVRVERSATGDDTLVREQTDFVLRPAPAS